MLRVSNRSTRAAFLLLAVFLPVAHSVAQTTTDVTRSSEAAAGPYPSKAVRIVTGYAPGSPPDVIARYLAPKLADTLGRPVTVENKPGAGSTLGPAAVAVAAPDGYTLLAAGTSDLAVAPAMGVPVRYDSISDFAPVILITNHPFWILVYPGLAANSLTDFVALAKSRPGQLAYGSAGTGNLTHLAAEQFKAIAGIDMLHVPYKGGVPAITDTVAGRVALYIGPMLGTQQYVADKRLRVLAVTSPSRSMLAPEIPTAAEAGFPGVDIVGLTALLAPAGTPSAVITRLNAEVNRLLDDPAMRGQLARLAAEVVGGKPEQLSSRTRDDIAKWSAVVKKAGIKPD